MEIEGEFQDGAEFKLTSKPSNLAQATFIAIWEGHARITRRLMTWDKSGTSTRARGVGEILSGPKTSPPALNSGTAYGYFMGTNEKSRSVEQLTY
ncbi:hypothetical protein [Magnetovibrio blakemorei]|uniref:hypothetical protein n=1 Tax=Magnetovibrio blakemorei TaxID=28181 RepID=UPI001112CB54|nr:hypothetical protein [Magnetovibrio blakemorei]